MDKRNDPHTFVPPTELGQADQSFSSRLPGYTSQQSSIGARPAGHVHQSGCRPGTLILWLVAIAMIFAAGLLMGQHPGDKATIW
jgi:hypothetical protein